MILPPVQLNRRIQPNLYYDWMPKNGQWPVVGTSPSSSPLGKITFDDMYNGRPLVNHRSQLTSVEKAMAILASHPNLVESGITVSPYANMPTLPPPSSQGRYIRPIRRVVPSPEVSSNTTERFMAACPTPGELFDAVRPWGTIREVRVWMEPCLHGTGQRDENSWGARIEFWHEDEARRLEIGFGQSASQIKGWQV